jgi:hypothetical protein
MIPELAGLDGPAAAAAGQIEVTIQRIEEIAKTTVAGAESSASESSSSFRNLKLSHAAFGDVPLARQLATQHQAAHEVFVETVQGVVQDLRDFQSKLIASAKAHQGTDDAAYATLVSLGRGYQHHDFHSEDNWRKSRAEQGDRLPGQDAVRPEGSDPGTPAGAAPAGASQPAPGGTGGHGYSGTP